MKNPFYYILLCTIILFSCNDKIHDNKYDTKAIKKLDLLSETIGKLNSCSFTLNTIDIDDNGNSILSENDIYMNGPNKLFLHSKSTKEKKSYWYDGERLAFFSYDRNEYDIITSSGNIIETIDFVHKKYDIDFPAADIFYPSLTDDIIKNYDQVLFDEDTSISGKINSIIFATSNTDTLKLIIDDINNVPYKMFISSEGKFYEGIFSNWKLNPSLPDIMFEFKPPFNSKRKKIEMIKK